MKKNKSFNFWKNFNNPDISVKQNLEERKEIEQEEIKQYNK